MNKLIHYDIALFSKINGEWHNQFFDWFFPLMRNQYTWAPLYLFALVFMLQHFKWKGFGWICFFLITFAITDMFSSALIKPLVGRLRPCADPLLADAVRSIVGCGGRWSFPSSHASNHFGLAMFSFKTLLFVPVKWRWLLFLWAVVICYAQIYIGVHYPVDIVGGTLLGCTIGYLTGTIFNKRVGFGSLV
ncbi:MAG: phosphatase PAP2 family protein [Chitinophagaceae bacterium]|nr:phosphatase PAP2 family protein [Chitinophagaceae bacterium]